LTTSSPTSNDTCRNRGTRKGEGHLHYLSHIVAALVLAATPFTASGKPIGMFRFVVTDAGDQTDPSIDGERVVYAGPGAAVDAGTDVLVYDTVTGHVAVVGGGPGAQHAPDLHGTIAVYLDPAGVAIRDLDPLAPVADVRLPGGEVEAGDPAIGEEAAAWEVGPAGGRDVRVCRYRAGEEYTLLAPDGGDPVGDQLAPAVFGGLVGYVDGRAQGAAWLHDSATRLSRQVCEGRVTGLSVGDDGAGVVVAVARSTAEHDDDIEVYDAGGKLLAALRVPGVQRNPHVSREWVAFEDVSTAFSQVVLWKWDTDLVFVPHPTVTQQVLNDLSFVWPEEVRVVFEDTEGPETGRDIALYLLDVYPGILFDDQPNGYPLAPVDAPPSSVCDPAAPALATLDLARELDRPEAGQVEFTVAVPEGAAALPIALCVDAQDVSAAWIALDDVALATPADFEPSVVSLARPANLAPGTARLSGVIAGKPGAWLRARVVVDSSRPAPGTADVAGTGRTVPAAAREATGGGCSTAGAEVGLAALTLLLLAPRVRRRA
jgi:hypothetical protein